MLCYFCYARRFVPRPSESQQTGAIASLRSRLHQEGEKQSTPVIATFFG
jgi:hypothetical protein